MDQEVVATRQTNNPVTRGYRVYWGEGEEETDEVINETDFSDAFGYEETKDKNGPETFKTFVKELGLDKEEAAERTRQQGKEPDAKKHRQKLERVPKKIKKQKGFIDRMTISEKENLEEEKKEMMKKMVEDIVLKKKSGDKEMGKKSGLSKVLMKNLENIKKLADKEGIEINDLVKILKTDRGSIKRQKRDASDSGMQNQYLSTHRKDNVRDLNRPSKSHHSIYEDYNKEVVDNLKRINEIMKKL